MLFEAIVDAHTRRRCARTTDNGNQAIRKAYHEHSVCRWAKTSSQTIHCTKHHSGVSYSFLFSFSLLKIQISLSYTLQYRKGNNLWIYCSIYENIPKIYLNLHFLCRLSKCWICYKWLRCSLINQGQSWNFRPLGGSASVHNALLSRFLSLWGCPSTGVLLQAGLAIVVLSFVISFLGVGFTVGFSEGPVFHQVLMNAAFLFFICVVNALTVTISPDTL